MTWSSRVRVESQELSSHFESLVCKLESMSSHTKFHIFSTTFFAVKWRPTCYKMAADKLESGAQCCFTRLIKGCLYLSFLSLYFTCLFHTQSFQKVLPNLATSVAPLRLRCVECASHHEQYVREEQHPYICGANKQKQNEQDVGTLWLLGATM